MGSKKKNRRKQDPLAKVLLLTAILELVKAVIELLDRATE